MKALDICSGFGGLSDGLAEEGFEVIGIEINPEVATQYKHEVIVADIKTFDAYEFRGKIDLVVGSPPCRDFTRLPDKGHTPWKDPKNPARGYELVHHFLRIVDEVQPTYWLMENVPGLAKFIKDNNLPLGKPRCKARFSKGMYRCLWGNFPAFPIPIDYNKPSIWHTQGKFRKWERAKWPISVSRALGRVVRESLHSRNNIKGE